MSKLYPRQYTRYKSDKYYRKEREAAYDDYLDAIEGKHDLITGDSEADAKYHDLVVDKMQKAWVRLETKSVNAYIDSVIGNKEQIISDANDMLRQVDIDYFVTLYKVLPPDQTGVILKPLTPEIIHDLKKTIQGQVYGHFLNEQGLAAAGMHIDEDGETGIQNADNEVLIDFLALIDIRIKELIDKAGDLQAFCNQIVKLSKDTDKQDIGKDFAKEKAILTKFATPPEKFFTPNSYVASAFPLWAKNYYEGQIEFGIEQVADISGKKSEDNIPVYFSLTLDTDLVDEDTGKQIISYDKGKIKGFDLSVHDAICSFIEAGQNTLYISAIDRFMSGGKKVNISNTRQERILSALRKLSGTRLYLNAANDTRLKEHGIKELVYDEAMVTYTGLELTTYAGQKTYVFNVEKLPPMYRYSKTKGEIVSFATNLLNTGDRSDERTTPLKIQLLKRITLINKHQMAQTSISFDYIYSRADTEQPQTRVQWQRDITRFKGWLKYWQDIGYIKGFTIDKKAISIKPSYLEPQKRYDKPVEITEQTDL